MATGSGFGVVSATAAGAASESRADAGEATRADHRPLTEGLGCTEMYVDAFTVPAGGAVDLDSDTECVVVALGTGTPIILDGRFAVPEDGVACVPAGRPCTVGAEEATTVLAVRAYTDVTAGAEPTILDLDAVEYRLPSTSDVATAFLTASLGCSGLKVNARLLEPGQVVPYHTEGTQEELFVPLDGASSMRIDGERIPTPRGTVVRVAPESRRSARNDGDGESRWLMFGAPPTGQPEGWDPGATIVE